MDKVAEMLKKHRWRKDCRRISIVPPEERVTIKGPKGDRRLTKNFCQTESFSRFNKGQARFSEAIEEILPDWFVPGENFTMTINKDVTCYPHKDSGNVGDSAILFLGDFIGGEMHGEDGTVLSEKRVWHRFNGAEVLHWNLPHEGTKYTVIASNNKRPICYHRKKDSLP